MKRCELVLLDEVNCKFNNLDPGTRRKLVNALKFFEPSAYYSFAYKTGRWDGYKSFCTVSGQTYINLLDELLPIVFNEGYTIDTIDQRPTWDFKFEQIDENFWANMDCRWPAAHPKAGELIYLRSHQVEAINYFATNYQSLGEIATGAGKTLITSTLSWMVEKYGKTIVIVPNKSLVTQTYEDYANVKLDVGVYYGDKKELDKTHTICTWQSLEALRKLGQGLSKDKQPLREWAKDKVGVIVDECFHPDTLIKTDLGYKRIADINKGDTVINYCENTKKFKTDIVEKVHKNLSINEDLFEIEFENGTIIKVTANHKFLTHNRGWVAVKDLTDDDDIVEYYDE